MPSTERTYSHYSDKPLVLDDRGYTNVDEIRSVALSGQFKPNGLWLSVDGEHDWKHWCEMEKFCLRKLTYRTCVVLDESRLLVIDTLAKLDAFDREHARISDLNPFAVAWGLVSRRYSGIVIAPYQWGRRMDYMWYYPWDCASACVWDLKAVRNVSGWPSGQAADCNPALGGFDSHPTVQSLTYKEAP